MSDFTLMYNMFNYVVPHSCTKGRLCMCRCVYLLLSGCKLLAMVCDSSQFDCPSHFKLSHRADSHLFSHMCSVNVSIHRTAEYAENTLLPSK